MDTFSSDQDVSPMLVEDNSSKSRIGKQIILANVGVVVLIGISVGLSGCSQGPTLASVNGKDRTVKIKLASATPHCEDQASPGSMGYNVILTPSWGFKCPAVTFTNTYWNCWNHHRGNYPHSTITDSGIKNNGNNSSYIPLEDLIPVVTGIAHNCTPDETNCSTDNKTLYNFNHHFDTDPGPDLVLARYSSPTIHDTVVKKLRDRLGDKADVSVQKSGLHFTLGYTSELHKSLYGEIEKCITAWSSPKSGPPGAHMNLVIIDRATHQWLYGQKLYEQS